MEKYYEALQGITYGEWTKLKLVIDRIFDSKKNKLVNEIELKCDMDIQELIKRLL